MFNYSVFVYTYIGMYTRLVIKLYCQRWRTSQSQRQSNTLGKW